MLDLWNHSDFQTMSTNAGDTTEIIKGLNEATTSIVDWTTHPIVWGNNPEDYVEDEDDMRMKEKMKNHPDYKDQLENGIWWDVEKPSIFRWDNYDDQEKTDDYYWIISRNFIDGSTDVNDWPMKHKLAFYALSMQAKYGDTEERAPSKFWIIDYVKWNAWNRVRGNSPRQATKNFIMYAEAYLAYQRSGIAQLEKEGLNYITEVTD